MVPDRIVMFICLAASVGCQARPQIADVDGGKAAEPELIVVPVETPPVPRLISIDPHSPLQVTILHNQDPVVEVILPRASRDLWLSFVPIGVVELTRADVCLLTEEVMPQVPECLVLRTETNPESTSNLRILIERDDFIGRLRKWRAGSVVFVHVRVWIRWRNEVVPEFAVLLFTL